METLLDFHTLAQELEQHNSTTHGTQTGGGGGNVTSGGGGGGGYQYAVNMCNDFESAGVRNLHRSHVVHHVHTQAALCAMP